MDVTGNTLFMVNQMLTQKAKYALEMVWLTTEKHTHIIVADSDPMCLDYEALMVLGLLTDQPGSAIPDTRKFWLTMLGYEYTKGLMSSVGIGTP